MTENTIIRVFPQRTSYTPTGDYVFIGRPPFNPPEADEVHISCTFTWDKNFAEDLASDWGRYYPNVKIGGPAYDDKGGEFVPGMYLKRGEVITSRGCPNKCSYCFVPKREGSLRLLEIKDGLDIVDNNLLACPRQHIDSVLDMLARQKRKVMFRGGLDARLFQEWFADRICEIGTKQAFFAYDRPGDKEPLFDVFKMLRERGCTRHVLWCYVLVGYKKDTPDKAVKRLKWIVQQGATPFAMYYRAADDKKEIPANWRKAIRAWLRPGAIFSKHQDSMIKGIKTMDGQGELFG